MPHPSLHAATRLALAAALLAGCASAPKPRAVKAPSSEARPSSAPRLVVLFVVDGMRGDDIDTYAPLWKQGMARLLKRGRIYTEGFHGHARTETAAGHASIGTGLHPRHHGVVDKLLYQPARGTAVPICRFGPVPCDPLPLQAPTLGDRLKQRSPQSRVVVAGAKDRSAMLMGGRRADLTFWVPSRPFDVVGRYQGHSQLPDWLRTRFRESTAPDKLSFRWERPELPAPFSARPDDRPGEWDRGHGLVFPHVVPPMEGNAMHGSWFYTPDADRVLTDLSIAAAQHLELGADAHPDLLMVSLAAVDKVGHAFGPGGLERAAIMQTLDVELGRMMDALEALAPERVVFGLTADHGVAPIVQAARDQGRRSGRVKNSDIARVVNQALVPLLGEGDHCAAVWPPYVSLKPTAMPLRAQALAIAAEGLAKLEGIYGAWPSSALESLVLETPQGDLGPVLRANNHPAAAGDITFIYAPYYAEYDDDGLVGLGADHGTPWRYDRHVPLLIAGPGIAPGRDGTPVQVIDLIRSLGDSLALPADPRGGRPLP